MNLERKTPNGVNVAYFDAAYDVKSLLCKRDEIPLSMDLGCRVTLRLEMDGVAFNFVERTTCGARNESSHLADGSKKCIDLIRNVLRSVGYEPTETNMNIFFPGGLPSFDVMELIAQRKMSGHGPAGPGGVLV